MEVARSRASPALAGTAFLQRFRGRHVNQCEKSSLPPSRAELALVADNAPDLGQRKKLQPS